MRRQRPGLSPNHRRNAWAKAPSRWTRASSPSASTRCAKGCTITDIEGKKYIDFSNNMASLIHGHARPEVVEAVSEQLKKGSAYAVGTVQEIEYAEHLLSRNPNFERIRFANSGTEAVMACLKASRAYTGRPKIAKVEGAYHGLYDYAEVSQSPKPETWGSPDRPNSVPLAFGTPASAVSDVVIIPFNDTDRAIAILDEHGGQLPSTLEALVALPGGVFWFASSDRGTGEVEALSPDDAAKP